MGGLADQITAVQFPDGRWAVVAVIAIHDEQGPAVGQATLVRLMLERGVVFGPDGVNLREGDV